MRRAYALLAELAVWGFAMPAELFAIARARSEGRWLAGRLGRAPRLAEPSGRRILLHAVSAGEMSAAGALARAWAERRDQDRVLLTAGAAHGLEAAERLAREIAAVDAVLPLPWDRPRVLRRWLRAIRPDLVVVVETELWPGLFAACAAAGIPLALASARVYPRDVARYRRAGRFFSGLLSIPGWIGAQSRAERERLIAIGAPPERVEVAGDLKLAATATGAGIALPSPGPGEVWCTGVSTHPGEERLLLNAFGEARRTAAQLRLVLAPRHPHRAAAIARDARAAGFGVRRLGEPGPDSWDVLVIDRMGCLPELLALSAIAVVGGSFVDRGGQSPVEAARAGCAILIGPHVSHVAERVGEWAARGALVRLDGAAELAPSLLRLLADEPSRHRLGAAARSEVAGAGIAERYCERLESLLPAPGIGAPFQSRSQVSRAQEVSRTA